MRITVKAKLAAAFGAVIALSALTGGLAVLKLNELTVANQGLAERAATLDAAGQLQRRLLSLREKAAAMRAREAKPAAASNPAKARAGAGRGFALDLNHEGDATDAEFRRA